MFAAFAGAQVTVDIGQGQAPRTRTRIAPVEIRNIGVIPGAQGASLEVFSSRPVIPQITKLNSPPRLVIDIVNAVPSMTSNEIPVNRGGVSMIHVSRYPQNPPVTRIIVDLANDVTYGMVASGTQFTVELHPLPGNAGQTDAQQVNPNDVPPAAPYYSKMESAGNAPQPPAVAPAQTPAVVQSPPPPEVLPVAHPAGATGDIGTSLSAGADTAVMHLARGGELRVCPGTTVSVSPTKSGQELMLGVSTGSFEVHYALASSTDTIVTPDFRMQLTGPGLFDFAFSVDARGNTCVQSLPSNQGAISISEVMGDGTYVVQPNQSIEFRGGRIAARSQASPNCGCPATGVPVMRAESKPPEPQPTPAPAVSGTPTESGSSPGEAAVSVDAPLVFSGNAPPVEPSAQEPPPQVANLNIHPEAERAPLQAAPPPQTPAQPYKVSDAKVQNRPSEKKGFFAKMRGFFGGIFH